MALHQWGSGSDGPARTQFNQTFANLDARAAYDDGADGAALPTSNVVDGRYAQTIDGNYRRLFRRSGGSWKQVGGNTWAETQFFRADSSLPTTDPSTVRSHPSLPNPTATENWDGSSVRGARQAIGDLNPDLPGALHVGDTSSPVDLATRGRVYARTTADGQRGFVAAAHGAGAGPLFAARESGGTDPWLVDAQGRMRAQAPTAFGIAALTTGVPLVSAPGGSDLTAADLYAASGKPALRVFRAVGDNTAIASFAQDRITLGRASWTGGRVDVLGPGFYVAAGLEVDGAAKLDGGLTVTGTSLLGETVADRLESTTEVRGATVTASGVLSAEGGRVVSKTTGAGSELLTRSATKYSGTALQSVRAPACYHKQVRPQIGITSSTVNYDQTVVMPEDGWMRLDLDMFFVADVPGGNTAETLVTLITVELRNASGMIGTSQQWASTETADAPVRDKEGRGTTHLTEIFSPYLTAGTYTIRLKMFRDGVLGGYLNRVNYTTTAVMLHSASYSA